MTERPTPQPSKPAPSGGVPTSEAAAAAPRVISPWPSSRAVRTRKECLRIAADAGGQPEQIIARAQAMARYLGEAVDEEARSCRWTCLLIATQMENPPADADDIIHTAAAFEIFLSGTDGHSPA